MTPSSPAPRLLVEERRRLIVELVEQQGRATVEELAQRFDISPVTIRADLEALARNAAIVRSHGGAVPAPAHAVDTPLSIKETRHHAQKRRIGQAAARLVEDGETIILDSGSTLNALMIRAARETIGVFDSSKFGQRSLSVIAPLSSLHKIISDTGAAPDYVQALEGAGVRVTLV